MSISRKHKKKLIAAAVLAMLSAGAVNVSAAPSLGQVQWGSVSVDGTHWQTSGYVTMEGNGTMFVANQNTLVNWSHFNVTGLQMVGATNGAALVNQLTSEGHQSLMCVLDQPSAPFNGGQVYFISPYGVSYGGTAVPGINVIGSNTALITTMEQFNTFINGPTPPGPTPPGPTPTPTDQDAALREAQESGRVQQALNSIDAMRNNDAAAEAAKSKGL